jgi:hypothetical protein
MFAEKKYHPACAGLGFFQLVKEVQGGGNPPGHQRIAH